MVLRKQQKADEEAEERRRIAAKNFSEGKKRFREHRKKQVKQDELVTQISFC